MKPQGCAILARLCAQDMIIEVRMSANSVAKDCRCSGSAQSVPGGSSLAENSRKFSCLHASQQASSITIIVLFKFASEIRLSWAPCCHGVCVVQYHFKILICDDLRCKFNAADQAVAASVNARCCHAISGSHGEELKVSEETSSLSC
eukprot:198-Heterococcus_DN1.PRE.5